MKSKEQTSVGTSIFSVSVVSVLFLLIGGLMLFVPSMQLLYFCYIVSAFFLVGGIALLIRYFVSKGYKVLSNYDFSGGVILLIFGCVGILRAQELAQSIYLAIGVMLLFDAVFFLQYSIQLKILHGKLWGATLVFAVAFLVVSILMLLDRHDFFVKNPTVLYGVLFAAGILGLLAMLFVYLQIRSVEQEAKKARERNLEEAEDVRVRWSDAGFAKQQADDKTIASEDTVTEAESSDLQPGRDADVVASQTEETVL